VTVFEIFSIDSSYVLIQKETILNKRSEILKVLMNTVLTERGHSLYIPGYTGHTPMYSSRVS
jgi:hypothetical protein